MLYIAKLKNSKSNKPYTLPLKARVGGVSGTMNYQVDGGEKRSTKSYELLTALEPSSASCMTEQKKTHCRKETQ